MQCWMKLLVDRHNKVHIEGKTVLTIHVLTCLKLAITA